MRETLARKHHRQQALLRVVSQQRLSTQADVVRALRGAGFAATQATVSRDIVELGLVKVARDGTHAYAPPSAAAPGGALTMTGVPPTGRGVAGAVERPRADVAPALTPRPRGDEAGVLPSDLETLRHKDFAACTDDERAEIARLLARLVLSPPQRPSRRHRRTPSGRRPDLRRALRDVVGEDMRPPRLPHRHRRERARPVVLLLDVSGSMSAYSRLLLQFAWSSRRLDAPVEVFCFGTRLTRITAQLGSRDPDRALADAAEVVVDWDGGTRIGESVRQLLREHARRSGCRGAVVVICSDGLERGDPELLSAQLERLQRLSYRVVWVNPLSADPAFEPLTRGMTAALPHVDALVAGHSLGSLEALSRVISDLA